MLYEPGKRQAYEEGSKISVRQESSELYKKHYFPLPAEMEHIKPKRMLKQEQEMLDRLKQAGIDFDVFVSNGLSISSLPYVDIKIPAELNEQEKSALQAGIDDYGTRFLLANLDKIIVIKAKSPASRIRIGAITGSRLNIAVITAAPEGSQITVTEYFGTIGEIDSELGIANIMHVERNARASLYQIHNEGKNSIVLSSASDAMGENSTINLNSMYSGGSITHARNFLVASGPASTVEINDLAFGSGMQKFDILNHVENGSYNTKVESRSKAVVSDFSACILKAFARIPHGVPNARSYVYQRGISMSKDAHIDALPDMSIDESAVRATHSSAVSPIDADEIFYLMARGIENGKARKIILNSFFGEILARFGDLEMQRIASSILDNRIEGIFSALPNPNAEFMHVDAAVEGIESHYKYRK
ncbi:MAG: SufB/SufD family protein [Candidatus Micrarchaeia archaeon]